ncbi:MAG: hypothetical protein U1A78_36990 [Polyangia bacterium]
MTSARSPRLQGSLLVAVCLSSALGSGLGLGGCRGRKPLPVKADGGPVVEVVAPPTRPRPDSEPPAAPLAPEREPNDSRELAQAIELGRAPQAGGSVVGTTGVRGSLAPPTAQAAGKGDDDFYALLMPPEPQLVRIELSTGPRADVSLELMDAQGARMALVDERGRGEGERLGNLLPAPGQTMYLRVRGNVAGQKEQADADYKLLVTAAPAPSGGEREPDDTPQAATRLEGSAGTGALAWRRDEDVWVIGLAEAMGRRVAADAPPPGLAAAAVLRLELDAPGVLPTVKVQIEAAGANADGGAKAPLSTALELTAPSAGELRLRNIGVPAGSARAFVTIRGASFQKPPGAERYHLRLAVEPALEAAEIEPNDDCARATPVTVIDGEELVRGFLWPGDSDCFRLVPPGPSPQRWKLQLSVPADECKAALELVRPEPGQQAPAPAGGTATVEPAPPLVVRTRGDVLVRVVGQRRSTCFREPYRLSAKVEPDSGGTP